LEKLVPTSVDRGESRCQRGLIGSIYAFIVMAYIERGLIGSIHHNKSIYRGNQRGMIDSIYAFIVMAYIERGLIGSIHHNKSIY
jgi:hypothetical protein